MIADHGYHHEELLVTNNDVAAMILIFVVAVFLVVAVELLATRHRKANRDRHPEPLHRALRRTRRHRRP